MRDAVEAERADAAVVQALRLEHSPVRLGLGVALALRLLDDRLQRPQHALEGLARDGRALDVAHGDARREVFLVWQQRALAKVALVDRRHLHQAIVHLDRGSDGAVASIVVLVVFAAVVLADSAHAAPLRIVDRGGEQPDGARVGAAQPFLGGAAAAH